MIEWLHVTLIAAGAGILALVLIIVFRRCFYPKNRNPFAVSDAARARQTLQTGIARLHQVSPHHHQLDKYTSNDFRLAKKPFFDWSDHPSLVSDAVENGWPQFAFTAFMSSASIKPSSRPSFIGNVCSSIEDEIRVEIGWEVSEGSADFMQKIRLNPGVKKIVNSSSGALSLIRTALPLPGPRLENSCFPQEAYFEITVLQNSNIDRQSCSVGDDKPEGERIMLITEDFNAKNSPDSANLVHVASSHSQRRANKFQELRLGGKSEAILLCLGLTGGGPVPLKFPGSFAGSIGFNSTGSLYLDGNKLVPESEPEEWGGADNVIGCGYNPAQRKVFFTRNSQLVHEMHCKTEEFGFPLYPTLAANGDVMVLVNLGQSPFKYAEANSQRTSNPCFVGPMGDSPTLSYDDSKELFSMGRIDAQWLQRNGTRSNNNTVNSIKSLGYESYDQDSEGDLFEIVLDTNTGRSPYATPQQ